MAVILHRTAESPIDWTSTQRKHWNLMRGAEGHEIVLEKAGRAFTFEIGVQTGEEKAGNNRRKHLASTIGKGT